LKFINEKDLGLDKDHIVKLSLKKESREKYDVFKSELLQNPDIVSVTATNSPIHGIYWNGHGWDWDGREETTDPLTTYLYTDFDLFKTFNIELAEGRFLAKEFDAKESENSANIMINEAYARIIGKESAVGQVLTNGNNQANIVGVVKDFHYKPLQAEIGPIMISYSPERFYYMYIKIRSDNIQAAIGHIENMYKKFSPGYNFEYNFLDEDYDRMYRGVRRAGAILGYFALLAVIVSCLGLFGLASFMAENRTKEIGIRKVMGSSITGIIGLLSKDFIKNVMLANFIAWPLAYFFIKGWLDNFAYKTGINILLFIASGLLALVIALLTVSFQAIKAARTNPVDSLKYE
ncbi:ABC transporter permease, partial [candidate division KSB1 bacterium]